MWRGENDVGSCVWIWRMGILMVIWMMMVWGSVSWMGIWNGVLLCRRRDKREWYERGWGEEIIVEFDFVII